APRAGSFVAALFIYLLVAGGFPYTIVMLALVTGWIALRALVRRNWPATVRLALAWVLGLGLSAPAWLALLDYMGGSARQAYAPAANWQWVIPLSALPAYVLPAWTVPWADFSTRMARHTATEMACGLVAPAALLYGMISSGRAFVRRIRWELGLLAVVVVISMLPSASVFRWSFRWLPLIHLSLALCAAEALKDARRRKWWTPARVAIALVVAVAVAMWLSNAAGPVGLKLSIVYLAIALGWAAAEFLPGNGWLPAAVTFASVIATYLCIPPNGGVPSYNFEQSLTRAEPLDPQRLYLSLYPAPELYFRGQRKPEAAGLLRPGSTSMWGAVHLINGYSPIRPAGVARAFDVPIHGDIPQWKAEELLDSQAQADGLLADLGVDGIIVANEWWWLRPWPENEWELVLSTSEGRVFQRHGGPLPRVRVAEGEGSVRVLENSRQQVRLEAAATSKTPAKITFSRPYFRGYRARFRGQELPVTSWNGLTPAVDVPPGASGLLILQYRPRWLTVGATAAIVSAVICVAAMLVARLKR
ncbi:MAG: hypothetical protein M3032_02205, partial [Verrucomicrobiota bacterium]|nr:hypothetical protein [Verrucomicrobiota bacterium]